ncbi:MAG: DNA-directed RNA polymerase subunit beta' [Chloroflexi bacterium RBG_13_48_17]|nr:MAG: DNA-directed RNA polymerase subunit beta' [Chloroflexi bacterium RBG_13_48_17]
MAEVNDFNAVRISLASPEQVKSWSYGEVTEPETINYRTLKPEKDGLFCERIFGPTKNYECYCGKYKKIRYRGITCDRCGVTVEHSRVRRTRMGHIELAAPVAHIWFAKGVPSRLALLLDVSPRNLERVLYFAQYIVASVNESVRDEKIKELKGRLSKQIAEREQLLEDKIAEIKAGAKSAPDQETLEKINNLRREFADKSAELGSDLHDKMSELENLQPLRLLTESQYQELRQEFGDFFEVGMGAEAIIDVLKDIDLEKLRQKLIEEVRSSSGQRRKKASKRLRVVEAFWRSGNKPEWMILTVLPVLPPELRPIVQLDGGRFATSDLNDLYRRVINRNNRLRRLIDLGAPEIIIRNEKRMLQEAVDALIDSGRKGRVPIMSGAHRLKSLSDMLRGKQGRFRQNLLGKRVDYSGRSVIVVGPELKLHQCGLPKNMALELFKPFIMRRLIDQGYAHNIKSARRQVEKARPEVWDILVEVVKEHPVLLNRAPTLHRLSVQAFEPVLIDGSAIQIHPLVCTAFNADFDGDQMAVHVPLSRAAVKEAREKMLSIYNMLLPSCGEPVMTPTLDMVLGCYYLTNIRPGARGEGMLFYDFEEAKLAYDLGIVDLGAEVEVRRKNGDGQRLKTSVGRIVFNEILPPEFQFYNQVMDKATLKRLVLDCYRLLGSAPTVTMLDNLKRLGFEYATKSGTTIAARDIEVPRDKAKLLEEGDERIAVIESQFNRGLITDDERYSSAIQVWTETTDKITETISQSLDRYGGVYMMATSGAKGNISQIRQMAGMRGLMTDPAGRIIEFPIKASFREGLSVMEYFISTHGARKGLADTALRTSDAGYLTRRLIDVAQDLIVFEEDCGTEEGIWLFDKAEKELLAPFDERLVGRLAAVDIIDSGTGEILVSRNEEIDEEKAKRITGAGISQVYVRSPLSCHSRRGICQDCYGRDLARRGLVEIGTAVGIIAAQSIGEPGTQLTLRTFHTGGVVGADITTGLPRVEELFEARVPKGLAVLSEIDGIVEVIETQDVRKIRVISSESYLDEYMLPSGAEVVVSSGQWVEAGTKLANVAPPVPKKAKKSKKPAVIEEHPMIARVTGSVVLEKGHLYIRYEEVEEREYIIPSGSHIRIKSGDRVKAGDQLVDGAVDPQDILRIMGREAVQQYLVVEVQKVYRSQGVNINDKHIEIIIRQMLRRVRVESPGDTELLSGDLVDRFEYEGINAKVLAEGGEPATAQTVLLGITRASLNTGSWLAAASFQETTRVLTEAAIWGRTDKLLGLKENVIIGKLIPSQALPTAEEVEAAVVQVEGGESVALQQIDASAVPEDKQLSEPKPEAEPELKSEDNSG